MNMSILNKLNVIIIEMNQINCFYLDESFVKTSRLRKLSLALGWFWIRRIAGRPGTSGFGIWNLEPEENKIRCY